MGRFGLLLSTSYQSHYLLMPSFLVGRNCWDNFQLHICSEQIVQAVRVQICGICGRRPGMMTLPWLMWRPWRRPTAVGNTDTAMSSPPPESGWMAFYKLTSLKILFVTGPLLAIANDVTRPSARSEMMRSVCQSVVWSIHQSSIDALVAAVVQKLLQVL